MIEPPPLDKSAGMEVYATRTPPCEAMMKTKPEDFLVEEALGLELHSDPNGDTFPVYRVEKRLVDTFHLERELSDILKSRIKFVGLKDKRSVAVQYASLLQRPSRIPPVVEDNRFKAELIGYSSRPISATDVTGNRFRIVLRNCCSEVGLRIREAIELGMAGRLPNFFGLQRFGGGRALTHRVGRAIVKGEFEDAVRILLTEPRANDSPATSEARELLAGGEYSEGVKLLSSGSDIERLVADRLARRSGDFVGALRAIPIKVRRFFPQAYQSYIFNRALSRALVRGLDISRAEPGDNWADTAQDGLGLKTIHGARESQDTGAVPLFQLVGSSYRNYAGRFDSCTEEILAEEGISARQFYSRDLQEVSTEGGFRRPSIAMREPSFDQGADATVLSFTLARGQYATVFVREIVKPSDPARQGFA